MTTHPAPICLGCRHFRQDGDDFRCDAFPDGIPAAIVESRADHRRPYPGDHGIRFEPADADAAEYADLLFGSEAAREARA